MSGLPDFKKRSALKGAFYPWDEENAQAGNWARFPSKPSHIDQNFQCLLSSLFKRGSFERFWERQTPWAEARCSMGWAWGSFQTEFQGLYKSCIAKRLRNSILTISRPIVPEQKTQYLNYSNCDVTSQISRSKSDHSSLLVFWFLVIQDLHHPAPFLLPILATRSYYFSAVQLSFSNNRRCNDKVDASGGLRAGFRFCRGWKSNAKWHRLLIVGGL